MKLYEVRQLENLSPEPSMEEISERLDLIGERILIDTINWSEFDYRPDVSVAVAYSGREIFLKYYVTEDCFKAEKIESNQMVCEDSCVEFFVQPEDDGIYYNIEFNAIGTCLMGAGTGRNDLTRLRPGLIAKIRRLASAGDQPVKETTGRFSWTLAVAIPFELFTYHKITTLKGKIFRANFYKCGDKLTVPHYVTWNTVSTARPDYHRPEYFGMLRFI
jgi:hypothetical protein